MKAKYRAVQVGSRGGTYYIEDTDTGRRKSLGTKNEREAKRLVQHQNEALLNPTINRKIGLAYLGAADPQLTKRTWDNVMQDVIQDKSGATRHRWETALKDPALHFLKPKVVVTTLAPRRPWRRYPVRL